jgi:hypothetical protein
MATVEDIREDIRIGRAHSEHVDLPINIRVTIPFIPRPIFLAVIAGPERRSAARRRLERARHPLATWGNVATFLAASTICSTALLFASFIAATY